MNAASPAGSLQQLKNAQINRGGEIEKAKSWDKKYQLPEKTFGFASSNQLLYVFGSDNTPLGLPPGVNYQKLASPDASEMVSVDVVKNFSGNLYVIATYANGLQFHFYNGTIIADWYVGFVTSGMTNNSGIATALAALIDADPLVTASAIGAVITIEASAVNTVFTITGTAINGGSVDDQTIAIVETVAPGVAAKQKNTATIGGTFDVGDEFAVVINGKTYGASPVTGQPAVAAMTHKNKMYVASGVTLLFSGVADPTAWKPEDVGSGSIDISAQSPTNEALQALGIYQNRMAIFTRNLTQIWSMDPDPNLNVQLQVLDNIGTRFPKTVLSFGDADVFFLSDFGQRSLRARDASNSAGITDVGTPIDDIVIADVASMTTQQIKDACSAIEPNSGRYILSLKDKMYVFSFFQSSKISAWSTWEPGFSFSDFATVNGRIYARSGDGIYLLGGSANDVYTAEEVVVETPYIDARTIATWKRWKGIDLILEGTWDVYVNTNPRFPDTWIKTATLTRSSIGQMTLAMQQFSEQMKFKFVHQGTGPAKISKMVIHFEARRSV